MTKPNDTLLTRTEVAALLRCSIGTIDRRIADGDLVSYKHGRRVLIRREDVARYLAARVQAVRRT
ncbi:helix-turn-helix domain-containing protein [Aeromicrobium sp.]|uniref:helix-turn-helix domain-containing protein n=1 Tax=Aeromicrobium sp. TaxID=1871063 RepID=UPI004034B4E8